VGMGKGMGGGLRSFGGAGGLNPSLTFSSFKFFNLVGGKEALKMPPYDFMSPLTPSSASSAQLRTTSSQSPYDFLGTLSGGGTPTPITGPVMSVDPATMSLFARP
jgi:hypothetical protein